MAALYFNWCCEVHRKQVLFFPQQRSPLISLLFTVTSSSWIQYKQQKPRKPLQHKLWENMSNPETKALKVEEKNKGGGEIKDWNGNFNWLDKD